MKRREFLVSAATAAVVTGGATPAPATPADGSAQARPSSTRKILIAGGNFNTPFIRYMAAAHRQAAAEAALPADGLRRFATGHHRLVPQLRAAQRRAVAPGQLHRQHAADAQLGGGLPLGGRHRLLGRQHAQSAGDLEGAGHRRRSCARPGIAASCSAARARDRSAGSRKARPIRGRRSCRSWSASAS